MPKINLMNRETGNHALAAKRKRLQILRNKQQLNNDGSLSSNEFRLVSSSKQKRNRKMYLKIYFRMMMVLQ